MSFDYMSRPDRVAMIRRALADEVARLDEIDADPCTCVAARTVDTAALRRRFASYAEVLNRVEKWRSLSEVSHHDGRVFRMLEQQYAASNIALSAPQDRWQWR